MKRLFKKLMGIGLASIMLVSANGSMSVLAADSIEILQVSSESTNEVIPKDAVVYEGIHNSEGSVIARGNYIITASLKVTPCEDEILIEVITGCTFEATEVGARDLRVEQKVWYGWKTIAYLENSHVEDLGSHAFSTHCRSAEKGKTYRVSCTHYAFESDGTEHIVENELEEFVYN